MCHVRVHIGQGIRRDMEAFKEKVWLARPYMHGEEQEYIEKAFADNWITTAGENIDELERMVADTVGVKYAVGLSSGTAALHLAIKLAALRLYGMPERGRGDPADTGCV